MNKKNVYDVSTADVPKYFAATHYADKFDVWWDDAKPEDKFCGLYTLKELRGKLLSDLKYEFRFAEFGYGFIIHFIEPIYLYNLSIKEERDTFFSIGNMVLVPKVWCSKVKGMPL